MSTPRIVPFDFDTNTFVRPEVEAHISALAQAIVDGLGDIDLSQYATTAQLSTAISSALAGLGSASTHPASDFATPGSVSSAVSNAIAALTAGSPAELDTFLETYNRFLADETALSNLTTAVAAKATQTALTAEVTRATGAEQVNAAAAAAKIPALPPLAIVTAAGALTKDASTPVNATAGAIAMTPLPALSSLNLGDSFGLQKTDSSANTVSVAFAGSDATLTGATSVSLTMPGKLTLRVVAAPTGGGRLWEVVNHVRADATVVRAVGSIKNVDGPYTQAAYDALPTKDAATLYVITG